MPFIDPEATHVTYINSFRCQPQHQQQVVQINIDIIEQVAVASPGFVSASVRPSTDGTMVFNYLQWETAAHLEAMQTSPAFRTIARRFAGLIEFEPHQCEIAHVASA